MAMPVAISKSLPILKGMWLLLLNLVGKKNECRIIITSPDYVEFRVLWGVISYEKGEKREFVVRGTDAYIKSIISSLGMKNLDVKTILLK